MYFLEKNRINLGWIISKILRLINRPALRNCIISKKAKVGTGSNLINVSIGKYSYTGKNVNAVNAIIGNFCSIASYCCIGGGDHAKDLISTSPVFVKGRNCFGVNLTLSDIKLQKAVKIGNDVWIGEKVFIIDGITIGDGAIIGANSVVTHDIPPYAIAAGCPARIIRYRFASSVINVLLASKWWNLDDDVFRNNSSIFEEPINMDILKDLSKICGVSAKS